MRIKSTSFFLIIFLFVSLIELSAQAIIENSAEPTNNNHSRVLQIEEVMRITDEGGEFYFIRPFNFQLDKDGNIYIADENQLLKFSPEGKILKNFYKRGQGPGEIQRYFSFHVKNDRIHIWDKTARKVIQLNIDGELIKEIILREKGSMKFIGCIDDGFLFCKISYPPQENKIPKLVDVDNTIICIANDGTSEKILGVISEKWLVAPGYSISRVSLTTLLSKSGKTIIINDSENYIIKILDIKKGKIQRIFRRKYQRIKVKSSANVAGSNGNLQGLDRKYVSDIKAIYDVNNGIWVKTSMREKEGYLYDVFNYDGLYTDNFFLSSEMEVLYAKNKILFVIQSDENENLFIVKYQILN